LARRNWENALNQWAEEILSRDTFNDAVHRDWKYSRASGITSVPTFLVGSQVLVGAQPYRAIEELVRAAGATVKKHL
jgi:predicted DsbA family dithiol-disulfide isomerase